MSSSAGLPAPETTHTHHHHKRFSITRFSFLVVLQLVVLFVGYHALFPRLWARQLSGGVPAFLAVFLIVHMVLCFFEWFFHRYVLHSVATRWLRSFAQEHRHHHSLTAIRLRPVAEGSDRVILSEYPITHEAQYPSSAFPAYALLGFWAFFTPGLLVAQVLMPSLPILLAGLAAIAWSMTLYEILHAIEHWPYEWWRKATEHPRLGRFWRLLYGFHLMHHANVGCNEGIGGFFGTPLADWCFGTYHQPKQLLIEGRKATAKEFAIPSPHSFVRWLDRWARKREAGIPREAGRAG
jgi:hemolysin III